MLRRDVKKKFVRVLLVILVLGLAACSNKDHKSITAPEVTASAEDERAAKTTVHTIVCSTDQSDPLIAVDLNSINAWLDTVSQSTGFLLDRTILTESNGNLTSDRLVSTVEHLIVRKNDVVLFYYSGLGYNDGTTKWPTLVFSDTGIYLDKLTNALKSKGAKLVIALADSSNRYAGQTKLSAPLQAKISDNYKTLFQKRGYILASAAFPGELAFATGDGGMFTGAFLSAFYANVASKKPSWQTIMSNAAKPITAADGSVQHPQVELSIK